MLFKRRHDLSQPGRHPWQPGLYFLQCRGIWRFCWKSPRSPLPPRLRSSKALVASKFPARRFIAYFQAYTNTYAPLERLGGSVYGSHPPPGHCRPFHRHPSGLFAPETVSLSPGSNLEKPVSVELGLQTIHDSTAAFIRRGYELSCFEDACTRLRAAGLEIVVHTILGLPGETTQMMLDTIHYLNRAPIQGIKLQLLARAAGHGSGCLVRKSRLPGLYPGCLCGSCDYLLRTSFPGHYHPPAYR